MTLTSTPRRSLLANFTANGWQDLLFDYTMDEPHTTPGKRTVPSHCRYA
jgi:hypothetical protein